MNTWISLNHLKKDKKEEQEIVKKTIHQQIIPEVDSSKVKLHSKGKINNWRLLKLKITGFKMKT